MSNAIAPVPDHVISIATELDRQMRTLGFSLWELQGVAARCLVVTLRAQLAAANAELAKLHEDTARLDWCDKHDAETFSDCGYGDGPSIWTCTYAVGNVNDRQWKAAQGNSIRAAIDAARKEAIL
jgi:hypothetical protein